MNKIGKILLGLVAVVSLALGAIFYFTADLVTVADQFFAASKSKNMEQAYSYLSDDFRAGTSQSELEMFLEKNLLTTFQEANWQTRSINGGRGELIGSVTTDSGGVVPITLSFVKGSSGWKIYSIQKPSSGIQEESASVQMPSENQQIELVRASIHAFAESVNEKSMAKFHSHVSNLWQQQFTVQKFDDTFGAFYDLGADLTILRNVSPLFDSKPTLDENGVLSIVGHYPTEPSQLSFEQGYIFEGLGWKLVAFKTIIE